MAVTYSEMLDLGVEAPSFNLVSANPEINVDRRPACSLEDFETASILVVVFTCNHCPYAKHVEKALIDVAVRYAERGVAFVAINSNDPAQYSEDSFDSMVRRTRDKGYPFPYLFDETQAVAQRYKAACTPDFYVFDSTRRLAYRGRFDESRPGRGEATGKDLTAAIDQLLDKGEVTIEQRPSVGCNIKWKSDNRPA
jgi:peroxiredoxin